MDLVFAFILIPAGIIAGFLAGLLGVGGGVVLVPAIYYASHLLYPDDPNLMHIAVGTSLAIIIPTGFSSASAHWRHGHVRLDILSRLSPGILTGAALGVILAGFIDGEMLKIIFAMAIAVLAIIMVTMSDTRPVLKEMPSPLKSNSAGGVIGLISVLIGIGGATLSVPFMRLFGTDIRQAIGTASVIGLCIAVPGAIGFMALGLIQNSPTVSELGTTSATTLGYFNWLAWCIIIPLSIFSAPLGAKCTHIASPDILKRIFAILMIIVAIKMMMDVMG